MSEVLLGLDDLIEALRDTTEDIQCVYTLQSMWSDLKFPVTMHLSGCDTGITFNVIDQAGVQKICQIEDLPRTLYDRVAIQKELGKIITEIPSVWASILSSQSNIGLPPVAVSPKKG